MVITQVDRLKAEGIRGKTISDHSRPRSFELANETDSHLEIKDQFSKFLRLAEKEEVEQNPPGPFSKGGETPGSS
jgi:hypothetical protein